MKNINKIWSASLIIALILTGSTGYTENTSRKCSAGFRLGGAVEEEHILDDIITLSCFARCPLTENIAVEMSLDSSTFEVESPPELIGLPDNTAAEIEDTSGKASVFTFAVEYTFGKQNALFIPYLRAGCGIGFEDIEDFLVSENDNNYLIEIEADDHAKIVPTLSSGIRIAPRKCRWQFDMECRYDYHAINWEVTGINANENRLSSHQTFGIFLGISANI